MTNREYEEIIRAAFAEQEPGDCQHVNEASKAEYARLRAGLKSLADVPECQLTNERLRNAILSGGVRQKSSNWWFIGPIAIGAAAMFGFILLFAPKKPVEVSPAQSVALGSGHQENVAGPVATMTLPNPSRATADSVAGVLGLARDKNLLSDSTTERPAVRHRPARQTQRVAKSSGNPTESGAPAAKGMLETGTAPAGADTVAAGMGGGAAADMAAASPSVIVVEPGSDPVTRAQPAQEVKRGDVLFGG